jgi:hypothetical protein
VLEMARQMQDQQAVSPRGILIVRDLFSRLHNANVTYCHWKSNEHLGASLEGLTDLDLLVDRHRVADLQRILAESGFKRFAAPPLRAYPAIEDYLGCDRHTGRLVHVHLHYQLTLGERYLKGYRLPWESRLLTTRHLDAEHGVYVADPAIELVLLVLRAALKHRARDRLRLLLAGNRLDTGDTGREFAWLRQRALDVTAREIARTLLGPVIDEPLGRLLAEPLARDQLGAFAVAIRPALRRYRTYGQTEALIRVWLREFRWAVDQVNRRFLHRPRLLRRGLPRGGTVIVLLGPDGSGKSTLAKSLVAWLGAKLDALPIYFGSGDGPGAFYRLPLRLVYRLVQPAFNIGKRRSPQKVRRSGASALISDGVTGSLRAVGRIPWALALSFEKRGKLRRMIRARNRGMIVICDRYPQAEVPGFNDGPLLDHWRQNSWAVCRALAAWEAKPYIEARLDPPDLVIKLMATPEVALMRRPEMSLEEVSRRLQVVESLQFPLTTRVVELNADDSLEEVALAAKQFVWDEI